MVTELKTFAHNNEGFRQFAERYEFVSTSEELRNEFLNWQRELMRQQGMLEAAEEKGMVKGMEQGIEKGIDAIINELIKLGISIEDLNKARANAAD
jgi:predicted transposase/invertase (TIGR01784 family)